jgi:hypothetical protein
MNLWEFQEVHDHLERILGLIHTRHVGKSHWVSFSPEKLSLAVIEPRQPASFVPG